MIHKALITGVAAVGLGLFVFGSNLWSYVKTSANNVRESVKSAVPIDVQIQTAHDSVQDILPEIQKHKHLIAEQQVELKYLEEAVAKKEAELTSQKKAILALRSMLDEGKSKYRLASHTYSAGEVETDLSQRFERFKIAEESLSREKQVMEAKRKALRFNEQALGKMLVAKKDLEVKVEGLQARVNMLRAADSVNKIDIDDTQLARTRSMIDELNKQLDVKERLLDAEGEFVGLIPVEDELEQQATGNISIEIDAYFNSGETTQEEAPVETDIEDQTASQELQLAPAI